MIFRYDDFKLRPTGPNTLQAIYRYTAGRDTLLSTVTWSCKSQPPTLSSTVTELAALLGYVEGLSYWKAFFSNTSEILVRQVPLLAQDWCHELRINGMAECAYRNGLLAELRETELTFPGQLPRAEADTPGAAAGKQQQYPPTGRELLLYSGGKDSLATRIALGEAGPSPELTRYEWAWSDAPSARTGPDDSQYGLVIRRVLDARLRDLNAHGAINGHVPFSAYLGLAGVIGAEAMGAPAVLAGNTRSDDEPNVIVDDWHINHQWSKSLEFEQSFQSLLTSVQASTWYECPLRPFYELQVVDYLIRRGVDLGGLRTCNRVPTGWCGACAKCLWVFMAVSALTDGPTARGMLGFAPEITEDTLVTVRAMAGMNGAERPFECTGTSVEVRSVLGRVHEWLLPASDVRSIAAVWAGQFPLEKLLGEQGPRVPDARYQTELSTAGSDQLLGLSEAGS